MGCGQGCKAVAGVAFRLRLASQVCFEFYDTGGFWLIAARCARSLARKVACLNKFRWSSYRGYVDEDAVKKMVNYDCLKLMHRQTQNGRRAAYRMYVERCIARNDKEFQASLSVSRYAVADAEFVEQVESDLRDVEEHKGVYGDVKWPEGKSLTVDMIATMVAREFNLDKDLLLSRDYAARKAKKVALELACRYSNQSQRKVGECFGDEGNALVLKQRQRLAELFSIWIVFAL